MSKIALSPSALGTGTLTISAPNTNTDRAIALPDAAGTVFVSGQALSATTGTFSGTVSGGSTIGVGGATPSASGAGITFPATQSGSSDPNTLDDYEEGTWTPTCVCTGQTVSYNFRSGTYTRIGNTVRAECAIVLSTVSGAAGGNTTITGLPFANSSDSYTGLGYIGYNDGFAATLSSSWIQTTTALFRAGTRSSGNDTSGFTTGGYINIVWVYKA